MSILILRSAWLDNAKGLLIILVIWGHLIEQTASVGIVSGGAYGAIYLFHMPAFALISGMVSRPVLDRQTLIQIVRRLLFPLLVFQALYWPALAHLKPGWVYDPLAPSWLLWFLLSLATWRVLLPVFTRTPYPVLLSTAIAVAVGYVDNIDHTLSLSRTFVFFPAFLFGHIYRDQIEVITAKAGLGGIAILVILVGSAGFLVANGAGVTPLYGSLPYSYMTNEFLTPALVRLLVIAAGIAAAIAFLSLVPRNVGGLTNLGRQTFPVFLLHGFLVLLFWAATPVRVLWSEGTFLLLTGCLAVLFAYTLASVSRTTLRTALKSQLQR